MQYLGKWGSALVGLMLLAMQSLGQTPQYGFRISFKDKNGSAGISNPGAFLSQQALNRRTALGIAVDSTDVPVSPVYIDSVLTLTQGVLHVQSRWFNSIVILLTDSSGILQLQGKPWISDIQQVAYYFNVLHNRPAGGRSASAPVSGSGAVVPAGPVSKTTGSPAYYGNTWNQTNMVHGDFLHDNGWRGQGKLIAVLDAGFTEVNTHPGFDSLRQQNRIVDAHNFVLDTDHVYDYSYHGMQVLSAMAGLVPGTYVGSAPLASYALYCTEDESTEQPIEMDNMIAGMERADSIGADIIQSSLGYDVFSDFPSFVYTYADLDGKTTLVSRAANMATMKGMLVVTSAGNDGDKPWKYILTPGDADSSLTIGSVDISGIPAASSGYGPNAAGVIKPDVVDLGAPASLFNLGGSYTSGDGTSYATPQISGWAACLWQSRPDATPYDIRMAINKSANRYTNPGQQSGYGIPNFGAAYDLLDVPAIPAGNASLLQVWPNPFGDQLWFSASLKQSATVTISLTDVTGRLISREQKTLGAGSQTFSIKGFESLARGMYLVQLASGDARYSRKVVKQ